MFRLLGICLACVGVGAGIGWTWRDLASPQSVPLNVRTGPVAAAASADSSDANGTEREVVAVAEPEVASPSPISMVADRSEDARDSGILSFDLSPSADGAVQRAAVVDLSSKLLADEQAGRSGVHDSAMSWNAFDVYRALGHPDKLLCRDGYVSWCYDGDEHNDGVAFTFHPGEVAAVGRWMGRQGR